MDLQATDYLIKEWWKCNEMENRRYYIWDSNIFLQVFDSEGKTSQPSYKFTFGYNSHLMPLQNGGFAIVWGMRTASQASNTNEAAKSTEALSVQLFYQNGTKNGKEIIAERSEKPIRYRVESIAALEDGGFVIPWSYDEITKGNNKVDLKVQIFHENGTKKGQAIPSPEKCACWKVEPLKGGNFVLAWTVFHSQDQSGTIHSQIFNSYGMEIGSEATVKETYCPKIIALDDGGYVLLWERYPYLDSTGPVDIFLQAFNSDNTLRGSEHIFYANRAYNSDQSFSTSLTDGGYVLIWTSLNNTNRTAHGQVFNADSTKRGEQFIAIDNVTDVLNGHLRGPISLISLENGRFAIFWVKNDIRSSGIIGQAFNRDGVKVGNEMTVNTEFKARYYEYYGYPFATQLKDKGVLVSWAQSQRPWYLYARNIHIELTEEVSQQNLEIERAEDLDNDTEEEEEDISSSARSHAEEKGKGSSLYSEDNDNNLFFILFFVVLAILGVLLLFLGVNWVKNRRRNEPKTNYLNVA